MIDTNVERPIPLAHTPADLPRRRAGKKTSLSCLYRWSTTGCRGVILETTQIGATRCTSKEALARFFDALTVAAGACPVETPKGTSARRQREISAAEKRLARAGI
jgi:hypothetical protein